MNGKEFVRCKYPFSQLYIDRKSEYVIVDISDNQWVIGTGKTPELAWQDATKTIQEMERVK